MAAVELRDTAERVSSPAGWTLERAGEAVTLRSGRGATSIDPARFHRCLVLAAEVTDYWQRWAAAASPSRRRAYASVLRDFLAFANDRYLDVVPAALRFVDDVMLDAWVADVRGRVAAETARGKATAMRVFLANVDPAALHRSVVDDTGVLRWRPEVERGAVPLADLAPGQWELLKKTAKHELVAAWQRIRAGLDLASTGSDPGDDPGRWTAPNVYWLASRGQLDVEVLQAVLGSGVRNWPDWLRRVVAAEASCRPSPVVAVRAVYRQVAPTIFDATAFWVAMAIATGLPPESVTDLEPGWFDTPPRSRVTILRYRKQRRGQPTIPLVLLASSTFSAQRLCDMYLEISTAVRAVAPAELREFLWLRMARGAHRSGRRLAAEVIDGRGSTKPFNEWVRRMALDDVEEVAALDKARSVAVAAGRDRLAVVQGEVLQTRAGRIERQRRRPLRVMRPLQAWTGPIDPRRIRKTDKAMRLVLYGAAAAANDHTVHVLVSHYTNSDVVRVRSALVITGVAEALTHFARGPRPAAAITPELESAARVHDDVAAALAELLDTDVARLRGILDGRHVVGEVACSDPYRSPYDDEGRFCRQAGSGLCLSCPNAVAVASHVPRLWADLERLDRLAATMQRDVYVGLHGDRRRLVLELLALFAPHDHATYVAAGVIPTAAGSGATAHTRIRRRRARR